jgi:hypothetical protein
MPATCTDFSPVILFSDELKSLHTALASAGHADLATMIETKSTRSPSERRYLAARPILDDAEFDFDDTPVVSEGDAGAYVSCWVWVSKEQANEVANNADGEAPAPADLAHQAALRRRRLNRRISRLKSTAKNALLRALAATLYGNELDPETQWTQDNIEQVADLLDSALKIRG